MKFSLLKNCWKNQYWKSTENFIAEKLLKISLLKKYIFLHYWKITFPIITDLGVAFYVMKLTVQFLVV